MSSLKELFEIDDLEEVWEASKQKPTLLFKQSTTCPVSANAFEEFQQFLKENSEDLAAYFVKVRESRPVSNKIAEDLGVVHQSPQIILIKDNEAIWDTSHMNITVDTIKEALESY
mgnify:CR=1 FL=1